jgi:hypothetical protein
MFWYTLDDPSGVIKKMAGVIDEVFTIKQNCDNPNGICYPEKANQAICHHDWNKAPNGMMYYLTKCSKLNCCF